jgi:hypothetical protein
MTTDGELQANAVDGPIVARAGRYFRITRYVMAVFVFGYGLYSIYDGFYNYPKKNREYIEQKRKEAIELGRDPDKSVDPTQVPHPGLDVPFNQFFGVVLPPLAIFLLIRWLHISRGEYRLENNTLNVPGHPPVPLDAITEIDKRLWDRKGIAYVSYELADGTKGTLKLDDFIYDRPPTDRIYDTIVAAVAPEAAAQPESNAQQEEGARG